MNRLRVAVLGCSSFARRAMLPALRQCAEAELICVSSRTAEKAAAVAHEFGCLAITGYEHVLEREDVDAVYVPLPTGLHEEWCTRALNAGKHLLVEKSFAPDLAAAERMLTIARRKRLLIFENFQFQKHTQWQWIKDYWDSGKLGRIHLIRTTFGFPSLPDDNFRWNRELGGGALLDTGAYVAKASQLLLGHELQLVSSLQWTDARRHVDTYGEVTFVHPHSGVVVQGAFGFDYFYQCRLEILGTQGKIHTGRIFTAPPNHTPVITVEHPDGCEQITLLPDNHYLNMWQWFVAECCGGSLESHWAALVNQARLLNQMRTLARTFTTI